MNSNLAIIPIAVIFFTGMASAAYFSFANDSLAFEIYAGGSYTYTQTPYSYITYVDSAPYYYFDYPFRAYGYGQYHYFQPGWYSFDTGTTIAPDVIATTMMIAPDALYYNSYYQLYPNYYLNYSYYPSNYYYYNSAWNYYPGWAYTYGPMYYGAYYYPLQPTLTGQTYHPEKMAGCGMIAISGNAPQVSSGNTSKAYFYIGNGSEVDLDVHNVQVYVNSNYVNASNLKFDKYVGAGSAGLVEFDVSAESGLTSGTAKAEISVNGTFKDGTYCGASDTKTEFGIGVYGSQEDSHYEDYRPQFTEEPKVTTGSTSYFVPNKYGKAEDFPESGSGNYDAQQPAGTANYGSGQIPANGSSIAYNSSNSQNTQASTGSGQGSTALFAPEQGFVATYYGDSQPIAQNCEGLSIVKENFNVNAGGSKTVYFTFKNFAGEDFKIDKIEVAEYSPYLAIEATRDSKAIFAGQTGAIKVRATASENSEAGTVTASVSVKGHYISGMGCTVGSDQFSVAVIGDKSDFGTVSVQAPASAEFKGTSGFITFEISNTTQKEAKVVVYGNGIKAQNSDFSIAANSTGTRTVALNGLTEKGARVYFQMQSDGAVIGEKYTRIVKKGDAEIADEAKGPTKPATQVAQQAPAQNSNALPGIGHMFTTGLAALGSMGTLLGLVVIVALAAIVLIWAKRNWE